VLSHFVSVPLCIVRSMNELGVKSRMNSGFLYEEAGEKRRSRLGLRAIKDLLNLC
jgi:hypothetical protein